MTPVPPLPARHFKWAVAGAQMEMVCKLAGTMSTTNTISSHSAVTAMDVVGLSLSNPLPSGKPHFEDITYKKRTQKLLEIERSVEHKLILQNWNAQLIASSNNLARQLRSLNSSKSELYQILGFFFVFEGVIISAVLQSSSIRCRNVWLILALSAIVSVATFFACIQKLKQIAKAQRNYWTEKAVCSALFNSIEHLKERGVEFDLEAGQPVLSGIDLGPISDGFLPRVHRFCKTWLLSYAGAVFFLLLAFSGIILAATVVIVCDPRCVLYSYLKSLCSVSHICTPFVERTSKCSKRNLAFTCRPLFEKILKSTCESIERASYTHELKRALET